MVGQYFRNMKEILWLKKGAPNRLAPVWNIFCAGNFDFFTFSRCLSGGTVFYHRGLSFQVLGIAV